MAARLSNPNRLRHPTPPMVLLAFEAPKVGGGHRQRGVIQEPRHVLNTLSRVTAELCGGVPEDVDAGRGKPCVPEVPLELRVERTARDAP